MLKKLPDIAVEATDQNGIGLTNHKNPLRFSPRGSVAGAGLESKNI